MIRFARRRSSAFSASLLAAPITVVENVSVSDGYLSPEISYTPNSKRSYM